MAKLKILVVSVGLLTYTGCATKTATVTAPVTSQPATPPQVVIANAVGVLAQAVDGAVKASIAARDQGKVSQADLTAIENFAQPVALLVKSLDAELDSADTWPVQKSKILALINAAGLAQLKGRISPTAQALVSVIISSVNQISVATGGPQI